MKTHGKSNSKLYKVWAGMKQRCYNPNDNFYYCYGGKGITVCEKWKDNFQNFYEWAICNGYNENLTIDRIDCNKNYCPENCRWVNALIQSRNRTDRKRYEYKGKKLLLSEISEITGIKLRTLWQRLQRGIALDEPIQTNNKKMVLIDNKVLNELPGIKAHTVGDYTGLTDKNGKRIFEGDIIAIDEDSIYYHTASGPVRTYKGMWVSFYLPDAHGRDCYDELYRINAEREVIGNIHDNPELL